MHRFAFHLALYLDDLALALPWWCYAAGGGWFFLNMLHALPGWYPAAFAGSLLLPFFYALLRTLRRRYAPEDWLAWLDWHNRAGGTLLAAGADAPARLRVLRVRPGCSPGHLARRIWLPAVFVAGALLVPPPPEEGPGGSGRGVQRELRTLEERVAEFVERGALPAPVGQQLKEQIDQLGQAALLNPESAAEGVAALRQKLESSVVMRLSAGLESARRAEEAARQTAQKSGGAESSTQEMLAALENLQAAGGGELPPEVQQALNEALRRVGADSLGACRNLPPGALTGMKPEDLKKLCEALKNANCRNAAACQATQSMMSGKEAAEALRQMLANTPGLSGKNLGMGEEGGCENGAGSGGVGRGRADAKLTFGDEADRDRARFEPRQLASNGTFLPGMTVAREREEAEAKPAPEEFRPSRRGGAAVPQALSAGESAAVLSPERSAAAERYFTGLAGAQPAAQPGAQAAPAAGRGQ